MKAWLSSIVDAEPLLKLVGEHGNGVGQVIQVNDSTNVTIVQRRLDHRVDDTDKLGARGVEVSEPPTGQNVIVH